MEQLTTYYLKAKHRASIWVFKYGLNGIIKEVQFLEMGLTQKQCEWLFADNRFPYLQSMIDQWKLDTANFEITKELPVLTFEALWELYGKKVKRVESEKCFKKLKPADVVKCFIHIPKYKKRLAHTKEGQANLTTYINQRYFEDEN